LKTHHVQKNSSFLLPWQQRPHITRSTLILFGHERCFPFSRALHWNWREAGTAMLLICILMTSQSGYWFGQELQDDKFVTVKTYSILLFYFEAYRNSHSISSLVLVRKRRCCGISICYPKFTNRAHRAIIVNYAKTLQKISLSQVPGDFPSGWLITIYHVKRKISALLLIRLSAFHCFLESLK
jgi:hypothetical protein